MNIPSKKKERYCAYSLYSLRVVGNCAYSKVDWHKNGKKNKQIKYSNFNSFPFKQEEYKLSWNMTCHWCEGGVKCLGVIYF